MVAKWNPGKSKVGKVGMIFLGGCGNNIMRQLIKNLKPEDYPNFYLLGANTDAQSNDDQFGRGEGDEELAPWIKAGQAFTFLLGGENVTGGYGAGAIQEVGERAARDPESLNIFSEFIGMVSEVMIVAAAAGGTSSGAAPVVAELSKSKGKTTLLLLVMPRQSERRDIRADQVLRKVRDEIGVQTIAIRNRYIDEYRQSLSPEERKKFTPLKGHDLVNRMAILPPLRFNREIIQVSGDVKNMDQADKRTAFLLGEEIFYGIAEIKPSEAEEITVDEIWQRLSDPRCQDPNGYTNAESVVMWFHGSLPDDVVEGTRAKVGAEALGLNATEGEIPRLHWGMRESVTDGEIWVGMMVVRKTAQASIQQTPASVTAPPLSRHGQQRVLTPLIVGGMEKEIGLWPDQADRYHSFLRNPGTPVAEVEKLYDEIFSRTGWRPDYPSWMKKEREENASKRSKDAEASIVH